jgi:XTP/dITP diphosphohydrolase
MNIILSSRNPSKALQIKALFGDSKFRVLTLSDSGIEGEAVEDGETLEANAEKKARYAHERAPKGSWVMAEDTGIFISALDGKPGVHSARWLGDIPTEEITKGTLERLKGAADRNAVFRTVAVLLDPEGVLHAFVGEVSGTMLEEPRVPPQAKMPYSGIFVPLGHEKCWAEMTPEEENKISHRGQALGKVRAFLESRI